MDILICFSFKLYNQFVNLMSLKPRDIIFIFFPRSIYIQSYNILLKLTILFYYLQKCFKIHKNLFLGELTDT
jgi:hypothetical protein